MSGHGVSPSEMPGLPFRRPLRAAAADNLLAGRGAAPGAPAGHQALARVLATAGNAGSEQELADEAAYMAIFVLARSQARGRSRARAVLTAAVAVGALAIGGATAVALMLGDPRDGSPQPRNSVQFGVPAFPRARADRDAPAQPSQRAAQARACPAPSRRPPDGHGTHAPVRALQGHAQRLHKPKSRPPTSGLSKAVKPT